MSDRPVSTRTREGDGGRVARFLVCYRKIKDPLIAAVLIPTAIATVILGLELRGYAEDRATDSAVVRVLAERQDKQQKATAIAAKSNCQRTRQYGPAFADYFESVGVFSAKDAAAYRSSIPKVCPK